MFTARINQMWDKVSGSLERFPSFGEILSRLVGLVLNTSNQSHR